MKHNLLTILGHTAGGKTSLAAQVSFRLGGEIISADSRQVYRDMDIGTGKDYSDYIVAGEKIPCHLIDIREAGSAYNVFEFRKDFNTVFNDITSRNALPVLCGGSGMYIESVLRNYKLVEVPVNHALRKELEELPDEELIHRLAAFGPLHNRTDTGSRKRLIRALEIAMYQADSRPETTDLPELTPLVFGLRFERSTRRARITERLRYRLEHGMVDEARSMLENGITEETMEYYGLEYKYLAWYLSGKIAYDEMFTGLNTAIHRFAKRQMTYFRGMEKRGTTIQWLEGEDGQEKNVQKIVMAMQAT